MAKLLPVIVLILLFAGALLYIRFQSSSQSSISESVTQISQKIDENSNATESEKIKTLEESIKLLASEIGKLKASLGSSGEGGALNITSPITEIRLKNLETSVRLLQSDVATLKSSSSQTTSTSTKNPPFYIPLGGADTANDKNFTSLATYQVEIDSADYLGYSGAQLEVNLKMGEAVGTANVRLYNSTDGLAISSSQVSTNSTQYTWLVSPSFKLSSGKKTYVLQVQSTEGYTVYIQSARLKVSF